MPTFIPRQFLVKAIVMGLRKNPELLNDKYLDILSTKIADRVEEAIELLESSDDPIEIVRDRPVPSSPEDIGNDDPRPPSRPAGTLPQPPMQSQKIILPGSAEARETLEELSKPVTQRKVTAIRPSRSVRPESDHEVPNWKFSHLHSSVLANTPTSIEVKVDGSEQVCSMDRICTASAPVIKISYVLSGQRDSSPSVPNPSGAELDAVSIPFEVSESVSTYSERDLDFDRIVFSLKARAALVLKPRATSIVSFTPRRSGSLDTLLSESMRAEAVAERGGAPVKTPATSEQVGDEAFEGIRGPADHWDPKFRNSQPGRK